MTPGDIRTILGVPATGSLVALGELPNNEVAHREAAMFFISSDRWERQGIPLETMVMLGVP